MLMKHSIVKQCTLSYYIRAYHIKNYDVRLIAFQNIPDLSLFGQKYTAIYKIVYGQ